MTKKLESKGRGPADRAVVRTGVQRIHRRQLRADLVADCVGPVGKGCDIVGLTGGQWSLCDLMAHVMAATGPARVSLGTWSAGAAEIDWLKGEMEAGHITGLRAVFDWSFPSRQPAYFLAARRAFSDGLILSRIHAKFITIEGGGLRFAILSSANLNRNLRVEWFMVAEGGEVFGMLNDFVTEAAARAAGLDERAGVHEKRFRGFLASHTEAAFFNPGDYARDLGRRGLTRGR